MTVVLTKNNIPLITQDFFATLRNIVHFIPLITRKALGMLSTNLSCLVKTIMKGI